MRYRPDIEHERSRLVDALTIWLADAHDALAHIAWALREANEREGSGPEEDPDTAEAVGQARYELAHALLEWDDAVFGLALRVRLLTAGEGAESTLAALAAQCAAIAGEARQWPTR